MNCSMEGKKIRTVLGDVKPEDVGMILPHEHLSLNLTDIFYSPPSPQDAGNEHLPFNMENLWWIRQHPNSHKYNLRLDDQEEALTKEMHFFKKNGGSLLVDNSSRGIPRNLKFSQQVSKETGVHIVAGTGYYVDKSHPPEVAASSVEELTRIMVNDITEGIDGVKCGVIGEIGGSWPLTESEKKVIQATALAQTELGCPVILHPDRNAEAPFEMVRLLQEAGGDLSRTVMSHLDRTLFTDTELIDFAKTGCILEHDLFGLEVSHYSFNLNVDMPTDGDRIKRLRMLVDEGYEDQLVIAHDIHTKHRTMKFGGHGYSHILVNVVPKMRRRGFSEELIQKIIVETPRKWLQF